MNKLDINVFLEYTKISFKLNHTLGIHQRSIYLNIFKVQVLRI
jgi:hypothetical protein